MIETDPKRARLAYARLQHRMAAKRLAAIHLSLKHEYNVQLAAEAIALSTRVTDLEKTLASEAA